MLYAAILSIGMFLAGGSDVTPTTIVAPETGPVAYAAGDLQEWAEKISGTRLPIKTHAVGPRVVLRVRPGCVQDDGFHLFVRGEAVIIEASEPRGCAYGVYALLEEWGCRFYGPAPVGVVLPQRRSLRVPGNLDITREPSFRFRFVPGSSLIPDAFPAGGTPADHLRWGYSHTRHAADRSESLKIGEMGLAQYRFVHLWPELLQWQYNAEGKAPQRADFSAHPDWLPADSNGHRHATGRSLCFSNPEALQWFIENAANCILTRYPDVAHLSLWPADEGTIALCRCAQCRARGWNDTDWYLFTQNAIRRRLNEKGWHGRIGWIAYHGSEAAPTREDLLENGQGMDFLYAPRPRGGTQFGPFNGDHPVSRRYRANLQSWQDYLGKQHYAGTRSVFEYYYDLCLLGELTAGRTFLIPRHAVMQEDMRFYKEQGFEGFFDCCPPFAAWWPDPLNRRLFDRLLWNVNLDLNAEKNDFYQHYYGPAAGTARVIRERVETLMFEPPTAATVKEIGALEGLLAPFTSVDNTMQARLQALRLWVRYCALCKESELQEKVAKNRERGLSAEDEIRQLLLANKDFLIKNNFMAARDVDFLARDVVDLHRSRVMRLATRKK